MLEERDSSAVALTALSGGLKLTDPTERYGGDAPTPGGSGDLPALARCNAFLVTNPDREAWAAGEDIRVLVK